MSKLNQYIGGLVSSITNARSIADMQAVELAKQYSGNELLQHLSVPRMRIEDIEMTIPVAMNASNFGNFETFDANRLNNAIINTAISFIGVQTLPTVIFEELSSNISEMTISGLKSQKSTNQSENQATGEQFSQSIIYSNDMESTPRVSIVSIGNITDQIPKLLRVALEPIVQIYSKNEKIRAYSQRTAMYFLQHENVIKLAGSELIPNPSARRVETLALQIREVASTTLASDNSLLGDTNVIVEASQLNGIPKENIIYIKMKIREEGMEWIVSDNKEGEPESKVPPETV